MIAALGLDVGTTSVKAALIGSTGEVLGRGASAPLAMRAPEPGWAVQSIEELLGGVDEAMTSAVNAAPAGTEIGSVTAAVQSGSSATVDQQGRIGPELTTWMDVRSEPYVDRWLSDGTAEQIRAACGWTPHAGQALAQLAWRRDHDPETWSGLGRVVSADSLVTHHLTGHWVTNPSNAAGMALLDIGSGRWSEQLCGQLGLDPEQLCDLRPSGATIGPLLVDRSSGTGISPGATVVAGGHDQACSALALGVTDRSRALLAGGTAWVLTEAILPADVGAVPGGMNVSYHVVPGRRTASVYLGGFGSSIEWLLEGGGAAGPVSGSHDRFEALDDALALGAIEAGSPYFLPDPSGTHPGAGRFVLPHSDGPVRWEAIRPDAVDATGLAERARAVMEYAAFEVRSTILALPIGARPASITMVGGATGAPGWAQSVADATGLTVTVAADPSLPALGAAVLGGVATGLFADLAAAVALLPLVRTEIRPDRRASDLYRVRYPNRPHPGSPS